MRKPYRRSRRDYPEGILAVYDNRGKTLDRYAVVFAPYHVDEAVFPGGGAVLMPVYPILCMSETPRWPQGVCQHSESTGYRPYGLGRVIPFSGLPEECQQVVQFNLSEPVE